MDYKEQLLSVYPNCKANVGHSRVTIVEIYDTVRNDAELKRRTEAYRQAMEAKEAAGTGDRSVSYGGARRVVRVRDR